MSWLNNPFLAMSFGAPLALLLLFLTRLYRQRTFFKGLVRAYGKVSLEFMLIFSAATSSQFPVGSSKGHGGGRGDVSAELPSANISYDHCPKVQFERHLLYGFMAGGVRRLSFVPSTLTPISHTLHTTDHSIWLLTGQ